jgi:hypothetical protein
MLPLLLANRGESSAIQEVHVILEVNHEVPQV